ncbi:sigma 54-interacting transcriptional regulator [Desulfosporosinus sp. PR]|uniref:sigma 54-interacting transcriptional regulator n=1 Tax=Candidatus Desulfosporosinus nitrosoreducens TaxID=3401928 RepID=UPI0027EE4A61|nr:sigma 54-interacting transcriptional regulator [Desulfosporosinus sp. PR]MDQ7092401.1 sigma 54-interacting transcriptional regulator [Desulfosporosinus sp. PR]
MLAEIFVTSPDKEVTQIVERIREELNLYVSVMEISFEEAVNLVKDIIHQDPYRLKVIVSGGATLELLRKELPAIRMVSIHPTEYEIVLALDRARMLGKSIGLFIAGTEDPRIIQTLCCVLGLDVKIYVYHNWRELEIQVIEARQKGTEVILGVGDRLSALVRQAGLRYISVSAGEKTIRNALIRAKDILEAEIREKNNLDQMKAILVDAHEGIAPKNKKELLARGFWAKYSFNDIIYANSKMSSIIEKAKKYSNTDCTVLIKGESGTGKELLAQSMHNEHLFRSKGPFIALNCASLDDSLFKSELFGYTEGSFTGAVKGGKQGLFELANGGTIFLDEIGKMKLDQQGNLLRVLQEKEVRRIGSDRLIPVDVRVIAASNEDLSDLVRRGTFREDLYFRLGVLKIVLPPLRERREDIPYQVVFFLKKFSLKYGKAIYNFPAFVLKKLASMDWPGNSRQLEHLLERCVVLASDEKDAPSVLSELLEEEFAENAWGIGAEEDSRNKISVYVSTLAEMNSEIVRRMRASGKLSNSELALKLGISRPTLLKMLNYN